MRAPILAFLVACLLIVLRQPDDFTRPQFFTDDGVFYEIAYNQGARVLLPYSGFWHPIPSLTALLAAQLPLSWGPAVCAVLALLIHAAPVGFLFSSRCANLGRYRWAFAAAYIALPETRWLNANICHSQYHLAVLGFLVVVVAEGSWKWFDRIAMGIMGANGALCSVFLLPVARRNRAILAATAAMQIAVNMTHPRLSVPWGGGIQSLVDIASNHIFLGALLGPNPIALSPLASWMVALAGAAVVAYVMIYGPSSLRRLWIFAALMLPAFLFRPPVSWPELAMPGWGQRYWFVPALAFVVSLIWMAGQKNDNVRVLPALALCVMILVLPLTWVYPKRIDYDYPAQVAEFERIPTGYEQEFRYNPPGWKMRLIR